jgi:hypothetical protein
MAIGFSIFDCRMTIENRKSKIGNRKSAIGNSIYELENLGAEEIPLGLSR